MGPTLVVMATKFGLGAEIQSPIGLFLLLGGGGGSNTVVVVFRVLGRHCIYH